MARKKPDMSIEEVDVSETVNGGDYSSYGGFNFPDFNYGAASDGAFPTDFSPHGQDSFSEGESSQEEDSDEAGSERKTKKKKKRHRRESDYFHVNRKIPCFMMFVVLLLSIAVIGISVLGAIPSMKENKIVGMLLQYTAIYRKPDMTPVADRKPVEGEGGKKTEYQDKSEYVGFFDILMGTIKSVFKIGGTETPKSAETAPGATDEVKPKDGFSMDTPFYDSIQQTVKEKGYTKGLPLTIVNYFGFALALFVVVALYYMIKAFAALFGKRVFKNFGFGAILMLVAAAVVIFGSVSVTSIFIGEAGAEAKLHIGAIMEFLMGAFGMPPEFKFTLVSGGPVVVQPFVAGYGLFALLALPVVTLLLSMTARKKLPYSIFE